MAPAASAGCVTIFVDCRRHNFSSLTRRSQVVATTASVCTVRNSRLHCRAGVLLAHRYVAPLSGLPAMFSHTSDPLFPSYLLLRICGAYLRQLTHSRRLGWMSRPASLLYLLSLEINQSCPVLAPASSKVAQSVLHYCCLENPAACFSACLNYKACIMQPVVPLRCLVTASSVALTMLCLQQAT